jgi:sarcosine oxidase subunit alpha
MNPLRLARIHRGQSFEIKVNGQVIEAFEGETVATAMLAAGIRSLFDDEYGFSPNRLYCNMGVCQQCLITVNHQPNCQACNTLAVPGMKIETNS